MAWAPSLCRWPGGAGTRAFRLHCGCPPCHAALQGPAEPEVALTSPGALRAHGHPPHTAPRRCCSLGPRSSRVCLPVIHVTERRAPGVGLWEDTDLPNPSVSAGTLSVPGRLRGSSRGNKGLFWHVLARRSRAGRTTGAAGLEQSFIGCRHVRPHGHAEGPRLTAGMLGSALASVHGLNSSYVTAMEGGHRHDSTVSPKLAVRVTEQYLPPPTPF